MKRRLLVFALCGPLLSFVQSAEKEKPKFETELLTVETRILPYVKLKDPTPALANAEVQTESWRFRYAFPTVVRNQGRSIFGLGIGYDTLHFNYRNWDAAGEGAQVDTIHGINMQGFWRQQLKSPLWSTRIFFSPGFHSDFESVTLKALRLQGGIVWVRDIKPGNVGIGLVVVDSFGRTRLLPALTYEQTFRERHKVVFRAPIQMSYFYEANDTFELGAQARFGGGNARLEEEGAFKGKNLDYSVGTVGPAARIKFAKRCTFMLDAGWTVYHRYQIAKNGDKFRDYDLKNSYFATVAFSIAR